MRNSLKVTTVSVAVLGTTAGGIAAVSAAGTPKPVKACRAANGNLGLVTNGKCAKGAKAVTLNAAGATGATGPEGKQGIQGVTGPKGDTGGKGDAGPGAVAVYLAPVSEGTFTNASPKTVATLGAWTVQMFCNGGVSGIAINGPGTDVGTFAVAPVGSAEAAYAVNTPNGGFGTVGAASGQVGEGLSDLTIVDAAVVPRYNLHTSELYDHSGASAKCSITGYAIPIG